MLSPVEAELGGSDEDIKSLLAQVLVELACTQAEELRRTYLNVARLETTRALNIRWTVVEINGFLHEVAEQHQAMADLLHAPGLIRIEVKTPEFQVRTDPAKLRQILNNLISNAVKYRTGGLTIVLSAQELVEGWELQVADNGPGIGSEGPAVFEPYERLAEHRGKLEGHGLGLWISKRLCEALGGRIELLQTEVGTVFGLAFESREGSDSMAV